MRDLVLSGGRVVDPASGVDEVAVDRGRIAAVAPQVAATRCRLLDGVTTSLELKAGSPG